MPFVAKNKVTGERIDVTKYRNPRADIKKDECICQLCSEPMFIKAGMVVSAHFSHRASCSSNYATKPESAEHRLAKRQIIKLLQDNYDMYKDTTIELERPIPEIKRVADILITFSSGWRIAQEIQLSSITTGTLQERTEDYERVGIDVIWWLGKAANTETNRQWCYNAHGSYGHLQFDATVKKHTL